MRQQHRKARAARARAAFRAGFQMFSRANDRVRSVDTQGGSGLGCAARCTVGAPLHTAARARRLREFAQLGVVFQSEVEGSIPPER